MKKFKVYIPCDYVQGYLRSGHLEGIVEAESVENIKNIDKNILRNFLDLVVDDYRVEDYEMDYDSIKIVEIKEDCESEPK